MSARARVTPEIIQRVKKISDNHPELCYWEIGKRVGICDETVRCIINDEYKIVEGKAARIYNHSQRKPFGTRFDAFTDDELDSIVLAFCANGLGSLAEEAREERRYREYKKYMENKKEVSK